MTYCGSCPGMCGKRADCPDRLCEGHPYMTGVNLHQHDGGHTFHNGIAFPIEDEPPVTSESTERRFERVLFAIGFAVMVVIAVVVKKLI